MKISTLEEFVVEFEVNDKEVSLKTFPTVYKSPSIRTFDPIVTWDKKEVPVPITFLEFRYSVTVPDIFLDVKEPRCNLVSLFTESYSKLSIIPLAKKVL